MFFAGCALLVTGIGLYKTPEYATARRTSEIGIRMALGAQPMSVMALVFRENAMVASIRQRGWSDHSTHLTAPGDTSNSDRAHGGNPL